MLMLQGYFASWATVVTAAMALGFTASAFQTSVKGLGALMGLLASSIIVIIALIDWVGGGTFQTESIYAMVVACITVVLVLAHIYKEKKEGDGDGGGMVMFGVLAFFSVLWLVLACLVTFRGPFIATGNGYFASVSVIIIYVGMHVRCCCCDESASKCSEQHPLQSVLPPSSNVLILFPLFSFFTDVVGRSCMCMPCLLCRKAQRKLGSFVALRGEGGDEKEKIYIYISIYVRRRK